MNSSIEGTSLPTSFSIVLYCDKRRVHAGEYLLHDAQRSVDEDNDPTHSAAGTESRTYARSR